MKQKDIALVAVVVVVSAIFSIVIAKAVLGSPKAHSQKAEVVDPISANFPPPDQKYFNSSSIDPTQVIQIGSNSNTNPFHNSQ